MFEEFYVSETEMENYSENDIDRFNLYLEERLTEMNLDPERDSELVAKEAKHLVNMYLTSDPEEWPF
ncbi:MAG: hypothetical protein ACP5U1_00455 [Desulfomonilaceae bacterium]